MRYIGGKSLMLDNINDVIKENTKNVNTVLDVFSGSGVVATNFKKLNYAVRTNDALYFSYVLNRGTICLNRVPKFQGLGIKNPISYLNNLTIENTDFTLDDCFIYKNYSPNEDCNRMYFQNENAIKIDIIRLTIENWKAEGKIDEDEYFYLLSALINAVPFISNITGVYGAYLKHWDVRTYNSLTLTEPEIIRSRKKHIAFNMDANELAKDITVDLAYLDPPYNERQYLPNYHVLETIAKYDNPQLHGVTGMRDYSGQRSDFCQKSKVADAFRELLDNINAKYILVSYNNEGLLSTEELSKIVQDAGVKGSFQLFEYDYRRYKNKIPNNKSGLKEQIYFVRKRRRPAKASLVCDSCKNPLSGRC